MSSDTKEWLIIIALSLAAYSVVIEAILYFGLIDYMNTYNQINNNTFNGGVK